ncbi:caspase family protein [Streptomyces sp. BHT-5-2]|uniref:caspase family protein n=1 Tax=Streptomyces sp. BHT-5-2 TaxID=2866715 RepID=UPI001C8DE85F|nr:caspase family protein [Streptomyces sp. BHT-5-2]QZL04373.1 caspase family protein [Streptomyces sp. BHT-5-2]
MAVPDPARSRAVLIGIDAYTHPALRPMPEASAGARRLAELLRDPSVWGLPAEHVQVLGAEHSAEEVQAAVRDAAKKARDTLLVYFAGHGLRDRSHRLYLALAKADADHPQVGTLNYGHLRDVVREAGHRARYRVTVLDCCYSGLAGEMSATTAPTREELAVSLGELEALEWQLGQTNNKDDYNEGNYYEDDYGDCVLTSASAAEESFVLPGADYPEFTGELIRVLYGGIPGAGPTFSLEHGWEKIRHHMRERGSHHPQQYAQNRVARNIHLHNRHNRATVRHPVNGTESPPTTGPSARNPLVHETERRRAADRPLGMAVHRPPASGQGATGKNTDPPLLKREQGAGTAAVTRSGSRRLISDTRGGPRARRGRSPGVLLDTKFAVLSTRTSPLTRWVLGALGLTACIVGIALAAHYYRGLADYRNAPICTQARPSHTDCVTREVDQVVDTRVLNENDNYGLTIRRASGKTETHTVRYEAYKAALGGAPADVRIWRGQVAEVAVDGNSEQYIDIPAADWGWSYLAWYGIELVVLSLFMRALPSRMRGQPLVIVICASLAWGLLGCIAILAASAIALA